MEITKLEKETREQHDNEEWFQARKMRFTASKFGRVASRKKNFEKFCSDLINAKPSPLKVLNMVSIMSLLQEENMKNI